jgi:hypothetical protein
VYKKVLNYGSGSLSHTFGVLVSGCTSTHVNYILEYIRLLCMCVLIYHRLVEGTLILRPSSTNGYLVWPLRFFHEVVDLLWSLSSKT